MESLKTFFKTHIKLMSCMLDIFRSVLYNIYKVNNIKRGNMSNLNNEIIKEDLLDQVASMSVDDFIGLLEDLKLEGSEAIDSLIYEATELLSDQRSL